MKTMIRKYAFLLIFTGALSCDDKDCDVPDEIASIPVEISIKRKEQQLFDLVNGREKEGLSAVSDLPRSAQKQGIVEFLKANRGMSDYFLDAVEYPADSILAGRLYNLLQQPSIDSLRLDTYRKFEDVDWLEKQFESAFKHMKFYYPNQNIPEINTMITGLYRDLYVSDSLIVLGIDFFVGADAKYKPNDVPAYIYRRFDPSYVVPASFLFLSEYFNVVNREDQTLLNEMITAGKSYFFTQSMMPCVADSVIIGFSAEELNEVHKHEDVVWANFVNNQLLYETNHMLKNKFMGERPNVYEIGEKCPGRIGAWVGWEIVKAYMEKNPSVSLPELMRETDAKKIFIRSKYHPDPH